MCSDNTDYEPVFIFKHNPDKMGDGLHPMTACFEKLGWHVFFVVKVQGKNQYLYHVGDAMPCNGSCEGRHGRMEYLSKPRGSNEYDVRPIIEKALAFSAE